MGRIRRALRGLWEDQSTPPLTPEVPERGPLSPAGERGKEAFQSVKPLPQITRRRKRRASCFASLRALDWEYRPLVETPTGGLLITMRSVRQLLIASRRADPFLLGLVGALWVWKAAETLGRAAHWLPGNLGWGFVVDLTLPLGFTVVLGLVFLVRWILGRSHWRGHSPGAEDSRWTGGP